MEAVVGNIRTHRCIYGTMVMVVVMVVAIVAAIVAKVTPHHLLDGARAVQDLNDFFYFVKVVDHGGFAPAGRALGLPTSRLSRRIAPLPKA